MKFKGITVRKSKYLGWREGNPLTDIDANNKPVETNYFVLVSLKDCQIIQHNNKKRIYNPENVKQSVILKYGGTYYGYGKRKINLYKTYDTSTIYCVLDGIVYSGTIRHYKSLVENEQSDE